MRRALALLSILIAPVLAGCVGADGSEPVAVAKARAEVSEELGGIEGIATDQAINPIVGASVRLDEVDFSTVTLDDGSFALSGVPPGSYTLIIAANGYVGTSQAVDVRANDVAFVDLVLVRVVSDAPFREVREMVGFLECGTGVGWDLTAAPPPPDPVGDPRAGGQSLRTCDAVNVVENTTNDRSDHHFSISAPISTFIFETHWTDNTGFANMLWLDVVIDGFHCPNYCDWSVFDYAGENPLHVRVERTRFQHIQSFFIDECDAGNTTYCGHSFFDEGWDLWSRAYPRWECGPAPVQACVPFQQAYTHYVSAFFNGEAPQGYSAVP